MDSRLCRSTGLVLVALAVSAPGVCRGQTLEKNAARFEKIWTTLRDQFYDPGMHGLDWRQVGERYRADAAAAPTQASFQRIVNRMLAELKASHLYYYTSDDFDGYFLRQVFMPDMPAIPVEHIGVMGASEESGFEVKAVLEDGPAHQAGIRVGDRLLAVDGRSPFLSAGSFHGKAGNPTSVLVKRATQAEETVTVTPVRQFAVEAFAAATGASARIIERDGKKLGYIHLWCMTHREIFAQYEFAIREKLRDTDGLVLDLRDGYGGSVGWFDYVLFQPAMAMKVIPRRGEARVDHYGYRQPLVALINSGSRSAKECFAFELKKTGRARLVGTTTAGYFLGAGAVEVEGDGLLMFPISDLRLDGQRLEGIGVRPDVEVAPRATYTPDDAQLAAAVAELLGQLRS